MNRSDGSERGIAMKKKNTAEKFPFMVGRWMMRIAAVMVCMVLLTTCMLANLYARYTGSGRGSDAARVAGFDVNITGVSDVEVVYSSSDEGSYQLLVNNQSDVAISYSIKVDVDPVDFGINVKLGDTELKTDGTTIVDFGTVGYVAPHASTTQDLVFSVVDWGEFTKFEEEAQREEELGFRVYIDAVQID